MLTRKQELISKYNRREITAAEILEVEQLMLDGQIDLEDLNDLQTLEDKISAIEEPASTVRMDDRFYQMLAKEKKASRMKFNRRAILPSADGVFSKLVVASFALILGFVVGFFVKLPSQKTELSTLSKEVSDLKEMMMLSMLEKESASERLKAVSLSEEMSGASSKVTQALLQTLNNDNNINVRLAALDALRPYCKDSHIREELVRSIARQESPFVQVALAELMVKLQEKSSVKELEKILENERTPRDVKKKIKQSITVLT